MFNIALIVRAIATENLHLIGHFAFSMPEKDKNFHDLILTGDLRSVLVK